MVWENRKCVYFVCVTWGEALKYKVHQTTFNIIKDQNIAFPGLYMIYNIGIARELCNQIASLCGLKLKSLMYSFSHFELFQQNCTLMSLLICVYACLYYTNANHSASAYFLSKEFSNYRQFSHIMAVTLQCIFVWYQLFNHRSISFYEAISSENAVS